LEKHWKTFLLRRLPLAILAIAVLAEGSATILEDSRPLRHPLDRLIVSLYDMTGDADILLFGDSVTQDVAGQYALDGRNTVANLTTNKASALIGAYFLLRRYLEIHRPPSSIVIASTPEFFAYTPEPATAALYLSSVFTDSSEVSDLKLAGLAPRPKYWKPAILEIERRIFDRIVGRVFNSATANPGELADPDIYKVPEGPGGNAVEASELTGRQMAILNVAPNARFALQRICTLASRFDISLEIIWAPVPQSVYAAWESDRRLERLQERIGRIAEDLCPPLAFANTNESQTFPDHAFRDPDHLRRPGWAALYGRLLRERLQGL